MKFNIETDDFWLDEDEHLEPALRSHITNNVVQSIKKSIEQKVDAEITKKVESVVSDKISAIIDDKLSDLIATSIIKRNGKDVVIEDYIKSVFESNSGWSSPISQIKAIAESFGKELKLQYNAAFANSIVSSMKEQGLLKDEVVQLLLDPKK